MTIQHCPTQKAPDRPSSTHWEHSITTKTFARTKKRHIYRLVKKAKPDTYTRTWTRMQCTSPLWVCVSGNTAIGRWSGCQSEQWAQKLLCLYAWISVCVCVSEPVNLAWNCGGDCDWSSFPLWQWCSHTHITIPLFLDNRLEKEKNVCVCVCVAWMYQVVLNKSHVKCP